VKRKALILLTASFILFAFSFTFSSCKNCNGDKSDPALEGFSVSVLDNPALAKIKEYLRDKRVSQPEMEATMRIATEDFGEGIGRIMCDNGHFWYRDGRRVDHDGLRTHNNCGLYAIKRMLFVLGKHSDTGIDEDLWYRYTDDELRCYFDKKWYGRDVVHMEYNPTLTPGFVSKLMRELGVEAKYCAIYDRHSNPVPLDLPSPPPTQEELNAAKKKVDDIKARLQILEERATAALKLAQADNATKEDIGKAENDIREVDVDIDKISEEVGAWRRKIIDEDLSHDIDLQRQEADEAHKKVSNVINSLLEEINKIKFKINFWT
jgi:hypothetical protein